MTSSSEEKIEKARKLGAVGGVNYRKENWVKDLKDMMDGGADLALDGVGGENFLKFRVKWLIEDLNMRYKYFSET